MKVLVIGGGGREHAVVLALKKSSKIDTIYCAPGNGGTSKYAINVDINAMDKQKMAEFCKQTNIDFAVVTPDDPLGDGMVDALEQAGVKCFGPNKDAALIESSKIFSKELMEKYSIPTGGYAVFEDSEKAIQYIKTQNTFPTVIKADGLAFGKGVIIAEDFEQAKCAVNDMLVDCKFGKSGQKVVIEEFLTGPELSILCFTDGKSIKPMISSMDHKRALDGDKGLNTGGIGAVAPNPYYTDELAKLCMDTVFRPTVEAMQKEGRPFKGCLYFGLMLTQNGPKVIEYNCRFGDPETQVVLPLLESDLFEIMQAVRNETLDSVEVKFSNKKVACVVMASGGYPEGYKKGLEIKGLDSFGQVPNCTVYHAGTTYENEKFLTSAGRVLGVTATSDTLSDAINLAYSCTEKINFDNAYYRKDIGQKALDVLSK